MQGTNMQEHVKPLHSMVAINHFPERLTMRSLIFKFVSPCIHFIKVNKKNRKVQKIQLNSP